MELQYDCDCMEEQCRIGAFEVSEVWSNREGGQSTRIDLCRCLECHRYWLRTALVDESSPALGKWYRGAIEPAEAIDLTEDTAKTLMASMSWHFYGGAYYRTSGEYAGGPMPFTHNTGYLESLPKAA